MTRPRIKTTKRKGSSGSKSDIVIPRASTVLHFRRLVSGAGLPQNRDHIGVVLTRCQTDRGRAVVSAAIYISSASNQQAHRRNVPLKRGNHEGSNTVLILRVDVGAPRQQGIYGFRFPSRRGQD